jgi:hypothetical protein
MLEAVQAIIKVFTNEPGNYSVVVKSEEYCVIEVLGECILIFYGSNSIADWFDNFAYFKTNLDSFPVGWNSQAITAFKEVARYNIKYVAGYSRGAAIAVIYSYYFNVQAIAFSSPRVSKTLRYWAIKPVLIGSLNDPVSLVPLFYKFPGNYIVINIESGGHFWHRGKFTDAVKAALLP